MGYMELGYNPGKKDMVCEYYMEPGKAVSFENACEQVAAESSIGTWTRVYTMRDGMENLRAKVFRIDKKTRTFSIAYPQDLFEKGNLSQILSSIAGNIFGMRSVKSLRLMDVSIPRKIAMSFKGPEIGMEDIRKILGIRKSPVAGTIFKPKVGLSPRQMASLAYMIYSSGIDYSKDDENLGSMVFNSFEDRVTRVLEVIDRIKSEQGRNVIYAPNITAPADEMLRRAEFVKKNGGRCIMIDVVTVGWSGLQYIRKQNLKMIIHAHRAGHAAFTRNPRHGISMLALSKFLRLAGVSALHTGTVVGKMECSREEVVAIDNFLRSRWHCFRKVMPIASGGLHPALVSKLVKILGNDVIINFGGGLWGHPYGPEAGAKAIRDSIDAAVDGIPLREACKRSRELQIAIKTWGCI